jgi:hypothetical protein
MGDKMKKFILFVILMMIGMAGAVQNFGPPSGIRVQAIEVAGTATVEGQVITQGGQSFTGGAISIDNASPITSLSSITATDFSASDDIYVTDDGVIDGALRVDEALTANGVTSNTSIVAATESITAYSALTHVNIANDLTGSSTAKFGGDVRGATLTSNGTVSGTTGAFTSKVTGAAGTTTVDYARMDQIWPLANKTGAAFSGYTTFQGVNIAGAVTTTSSMKVGAGLTANTMVNNGTLQQNGNAVVTGTSTFMVNNGATTLGAGLTAAPLKINGTSQLNGNVAITGTNTFQVNNAQATFGANIMASTGTINTTDGLTVGGRIVPTSIPIVSMDLLNSTENDSIFVADGAWMVDAIKVRYVAAASGFVNCTLYIMKLTGTEAPTAGDYMSNVSPTLMGTADTVYSATMSPIAANVTLATDNAIGLVINNRLNDKVTALDGTLTIYGHRV